MLAGRKAAPAVAAVVCLRILGKLVVVQSPARSAWPRPCGKTARSGGVLRCVPHRPPIMSTGCGRTCRRSPCNRGGAVRSWGRSRSRLLSPFRHVVAARRARRWQGDRDRDRGPRRRRRGDGRLYKSLLRVVVQIPMACSRIAATQGGRHRGAILPLAAATRGSVGQRHRGADAGISRRDARGEAHFGHGAGIVPIRVA